MSFYRLIISTVTKYSSDIMGEMSIRIMKDGPYIVTGGVPIYEKRIVKRDGI